MDQDQVSAWISDPRFQSFLDACNGHFDEALDLYAWHVRLSGASPAPVTPRCTISKYCRATRSTIASAPGSPRFHPGTPTPRTQSVVAALLFGFWKNLFIGPYDRLWIRSLRHAFPGAALRRDVLKPLDRLVLWRNRVAHHDSLPHRRSDLRLVDMARGHRLHRS